MRIAFSVAVVMASALLCVAASVGSCVGYLDADAGAAHADGAPNDDAKVTGLRDARSPGDTLGVGPTDSGQSADTSADASEDGGITDSGVTEAGAADVIDAAPKDSGTSHDTGTPPPVCALDPYACAVLGDQPLLYVRFDEAAAGTAKDTTGNNCGGSYPTVGASGVVGAIPGDMTNKAVHLSSMNTGVSMKNCADFPAPGAQFTAEFWLKPDPYLPDAGVAFILDHEVFGPRNGWEVDFTAGDIQLELWNNNKDLGVGNTTGAPVTASTWHYLVFAYDGSASTPYVYVDGTNVFDTTILGGIIPAIDTTWTVGKQNCCNEAQFAGAIDELAIYPSLLTSGQVNAHYTVSDGGM